MLEVPPKDHTLPTMYWVPKLHKTPYKHRFISASSNCSTTNLSVHLTSALTCIKELVIKYCDKTYQNCGVKYFWSIKNSIEVLDKLHAIQKPVSSVDSFDFSTLYTTLPHNLIKLQLGQLIKWSFKFTGLQFICCNKIQGFFSHRIYKNHCSWTCDDMIKALNLLLDNIYVRFGNTVYQQVIGIPMGTNCSPLIADLFLFCYERDFMKKLQKGIIKDSDKLMEIFNETSRYLDDILTIDNPQFLNYADQIYPPELKLNKANNDSKRCPFLDLTVIIESGRIKTKIYDKRDDFDFAIANFPFLDGDVPQAPSYGVYISQLVRFARVCSTLDDFNERNLAITSKLLQQGYRFHKLVNTFKKFCSRYEHLISKYESTRKQLISMGISHPRFYGNVVKKCKKMINKPAKLGRNLHSLRNKGYRQDILRKSVLLALRSDDLKILQLYWPLTDTADFC